MSAPEVIPPGRTRGLLSTPSDGQFFCLLTVLVAVFYGRLLVGQVLYHFDIFPYMLGQKALIREELLRGRLITLNPYILCGAPMLGDIVTAVLYPLNLLLLCGPLLWGFHLFIVFHYWLAAVLCYRFLRRGLGVDGWLAATGGFAYVAGGYLWCMADHNFFVAAPWVPLFFHGLLDLLWAPVGTRGGYGGAAGPEGGPETATTVPGAEEHTDTPHALPRASLAIRLAGALPGWPLARCVCGLTMLLYCGNFQQAYDALLLALGLLVWLSFSDERERGLGPALVRGLRFGLACVLALLLAAPQLLPSILASARSYRAGGLSLHEAQAWSFPFQRLIEYAIPFFYGAREGDGFSVYRFYGGLNPWSDSVFVGIPLLVGFLGLGRRQARGMGGWLIAVLGLGLVVAVGRNTPVHAWLLRLLPLFSLFRHPEKYLFWVHFALVTGGVLGWVRLQQDRSAERRVVVGCWLCSALALTLWLLVAGSGLLNPAAYERLVHHLGTHWPADTFRAWQSGMIGGTFAACLATAWWLSRGRTKCWPAGLGAGVLVVTALHLLVLSFAVRWTVPAAWVRGVRTAAELLPEQVHGQYRVHSNPNLETPCNRVDNRRYPCAGRQLGCYARLVHNAPSISRIRAALGFSAIAERSYLEYINVKRRPTQAILDLLCVSHVIVRAEAAGSGLPPGVEVWAVNARDGYAILENAGALPRIYTTGNCRLVAADLAVSTAFEQIIQRAATGPPSATTPTSATPAASGAAALWPVPPVVVSEHPPHWVDAGAAAGEPEPLAVTRDDPGQIGVKCSGPAWLVVRDWLVPGWAARLDGREVAITRADGAMMSVFVPPGRHRVELTYSPPGLRPGLCLGLVGLLLGVGLAAAGRSGLAGV